MKVSDHIAVINSEIQELNRVNSKAVGKVSDGYHTFDELYHHRTLLFATICNIHPNIAWKSKQHNDGTMYAGMFIVGIETDEGQATYHCEMEYWGKFKVKEITKAPVFDGHTPEIALQRIFKLCNVIEEDNSKIRTGCTFGEALEACKKGARIYREGWDKLSYPMFIVYQKGYPQGISCNEQTAKAWKINPGSLFKCEPYLQIATMDTHEMFTPTTGQLMATDWIIDWT